jgi:endonuclease/exonuclease/phosphatase family metal-dependent hydrolase
MQRSGTLSGSTWGWWRKATNHEGPDEPRLVREPPAAGRSDREGSVLTVATYNLDLGRRLERAASIIESEPSLGGADILALQEADEEAVERIAGRTFGYAYYAAARHPTTGRNFGPALLSRWPILDHGKILLPGSGRTHLRRIAVRATIEVGARRFRCYSVHLSTLWEMSARGQDAQARAVLEDAERSSDPVVIIGDLNRMGAGDVFARHGYQWLTRSVGPTHFFWSFDHVFIRGLGPARVRAGAVARGLEASDHKAVWAHLTLCDRSISKASLPQETAVPNASRTLMRPS